ncbi:MAG: insulinase family protein [Candidatus Gastranaerophilales bacterium]|nr:insulinase family protein [Candidatus Gastranaerophilales bacterium]
MSFQYIQPQFGYYNQQNMYSIKPQTNGFLQTPYVQNPYGASFYNELNTYPYNNPLFQPIVAPQYRKLGVVTSPAGETVHLFKLNNGQSVAIMPRKDEATIVKTFVNAGSMNEIDKHRGVMHVDEHGLFKGSSKLKDGDVFRLTSLMGASTNASTDYAKVDYYITAPFMDEKNLAKTIEIQGDMISNPLFDKDAMELEKGPVCSEISMINDDPMTMAFDIALRNLFQINSTSQNLVAGSIDTVQGLSVDDMKYYHSTYYSPENLHTVIVGDVDVDKTIDLVAKNFTIQKKSNKQTYTESLNPINAPVREDIRSSKINYTNVILAFAGPKPHESKEFIISAMIDYYLSTCSTSNLKNDLESLNASYDATNQKVGLNPDDPYALISMISLNPNEEQQGLDAFYDAIQKLQTTPLTDDEMKSIHNYINKGLVYLMCDSEDICDMLGGCMLDNSMDLFTNYKAIANSITKQDIMNFARKYYDLNKVSITVVHPTSVSEEDIRKNYSKSKYSMQNLNRNAGAITFKGAKNINTSAIKEYKLENNTHVALNDTNSDLCIFNWSVNTPPIKPKNPNIPAVLRYIFEKGTDYKSQLELERYKELNGIDASVYVNGKSIEITADCLPDESDKTLALMNELMYHPKFTQNDFEEGKRYVKDILRTSQKDATSNLLDILYPGYFPTEANMLKLIDELELSDIEEFYNSLLQNASSAFVATVPKSQHQQLESKVLSYQSQGNIKFKELTPKLFPLFKANQEPNVIYDTDDLNQAQIYKSYQFPMSGNIEDEIKFELLNTILGGTPNSRLFSDLRETQNLAYSVSSSVKSFENSGIITLQIQTTTDNPDTDTKSYDNVEKSLNGFKKHTDLLMREYVSDEELEAAKMRLKQNITGQCQNPLSETALIAMNILEPYGIKRIDKYYEAIDKITKEDIKRAANYVFSHNPTISILASEDTINSQMNYLKTQGTMQKAA